MIFSNQFPIFCVERTLVLTEFIENIVWFGYDICYYDAFLRCHSQYNYQLKAKIDSHEVKFIFLFYFISTDYIFMQLPIINYSVSSQLVNMAK